MIIILKGIGAKAFVIVLKELITNIGEIDLHFSDDDVNKYFVKVYEDIQVIINLSNNRVRSLDKLMSDIENQIKDAHMFLEDMSHPSQKKIIEDDLGQATKIAKKLVKAFKKN